MPFYPLTSKPLSDWIDDLENGDLMVGEEGAALFLLNIRESDAADYHVVVSNFAGATTSVAPAAA